MVRCAERSNAYSRDVPSSPEAVVVDGVTLRYGSTTAVDDVSFSLAPGTVTALLGPNGAGKTSLMEACEGLRRISTGSIRVLDNDPFSRRREISARVGAMLQSGGVYPAARVAETVADYCTLYQRGANPDQLITAVGLTHRRKATWKTLSGGERQRLSLALALCAKPEVAFLDEPTSGVDLEGRDAIARIVRQLADTGCAILISTHDVAEIDSYASRVLILNRGRLVADRSLDSTRDDVVEVRFRADRLLDLRSLGIATKTTPYERDGEIVVDATSGAVPTLVDAVRNQGFEVRDLRVTSGVQALYRRIVSEDQR